MRRSSTAVARRWRTRAAGATSTRAPTSRARQHRSMSSEPGRVATSKPPSSVEQVGADEHRGVRDEEHVPNAVVLFLVDLARLDARERHAVVVDRHPDLDQHVGVVVVDELGPDDRGVRPVRLLDHDARPRRGRARRRRGRTPGTSRPRPCASASLAAAAKPTFSGSRRTNAVGIAVAMRAVGSSSPALSSTRTDKARVVLGRERRDRGVEPRPAGRDHDRDDRWGGGLTRLVLVRLLEVARVLDLTEVLELVGVVGRRRTRVVGGTSGSAAPFRARDRGSARYRSTRGRWSTRGAPWSPCGRSRLARRLRLSCTWSRVLAIVSTPRYCREQTTSQRENHEHHGRSQDSHRRRLHRDRPRRHGVPADPDPPPRAHAPSSARCRPGSKSGAARSRGSSPKAAARSAPAESRPGAAPKIRSARRCHGCRSWATRSPSASSPSSSTCRSQLGEIPERVVQVIEPVAARVRERTGSAA